MFCNNIEQFSKKGWVPQTKVLQLPTLENEKSCDFVLMP